MNKPKNPQIKLKVILTVISIVLFAQVYHLFFSRFALQSPILFQSPIVERYLSPLPIKSTPIYPSVTVTPTVKLLSPTPTVVPKKKVELLHADIYEKVAMLESGGGKAVGLSGYCQKQGKVNSIGYAPHLKYCFDSKVDEMRVLGNWFQDKFRKGYDLATSLCIWNLGKPVNSCGYVLSYNSL